MSTYPSKPAHSIQGPLLALFFLLLVVISSGLFLQRRWWLPELASVHGVDVDRVFLVTLVITGILFIGLQLLLGWFSLRYSDGHGRVTRHWIGPKLEKRFAWTAGVIIFGVDIMIFALGESQWFKAWGAPPPDASVVEVTAEQFMWHFRYAGKDGSFGRTEPRLVSITNPLGIDVSDPASRDDIVSTNQLHLAEDVPVRLQLRAKDVIHSFFLPNLRVKQDVVPGMKIEIWFQPAESGQYEIACAQLCGLGHYRMRAFLTVEPQAQLEKWLADFGEEGN
jgi:cytochrome c oxidase subunit 2